MLWHEEFPILNQCTYLNTPGSGLISKSVLNWRRQHDELFFEQGSNFRTNQQAFLNDVKQTVADFFTGNKAFTFLVPNFSFGFNTLLDGLSANERILLLQEDYPSVNYAVESRGFASARVKVDEHFEESVLAKISSFKPTIFAFSLVQYLNGIKLNLNFLKKIKADYPDLLLIADGTQYCGTETFDFKASPLDVLGASAYKWLLGGYGNGFLLLKEHLQNRLFKRAQARSLPTEPFLQDKNVFSLYFEPGHQDTLIYGTLQQSLLSLQTAGFPKLEQHIKTLSNKAKTAFTERGLLEPVVVKQQDHSSIFNLSLDNDAFQGLWDVGIICLQRGKGVRVGFHFYNTEDDLEKILEVVDKS